MVIALTPPIPRKVKSQVYPQRNQHGTFPITSMRKANVGGSVAVQSTYDLLTVGETIEYTTDTIELEAIGAGSDGWTSVYNSEERFMTIRAFYYYLHVRRKVSEYKRVGGAGLANELVICALVNFFYMIVSPFASKTRMQSTEAWVIIE